MRSMWQILSLVIDGKLKTREQADKLMEEEITEFRTIFRISKEEARAQLLANIADVAGRYYSLANQKIIVDLFLSIPKENDGSNEITTKASVP